MSKSRSGQDVGTAGTAAHSNGGANKPNSNKADSEYSMMSDKLRVGKGKRGVSVDAVITVGIFCLNLH